METEFLRSFYILLAVINKDTFLFLQIICVKKCPVNIRIRLNHLYIGGNNLSVYIRHKGKFFLAVQIIIACRIVGQKIRMIPSLLKPFQPLCRIVKGFHDLPLSIHHEISDVLSIFRCILLHVPHYFLFIKESTIQFLPPFTINRSLKKRSDFFFRNCELTHGFSRHKPDQYTTNIKNNIFNHAVLSIF